jgi:hypothetical protein
LIMAPKSAVEKRAGRDCLHVRHLRRHSIRLHVPDCRGDARRTAGLVEKGMTNDQVIEHFVKKHGSQKCWLRPSTRASPGCCMDRRGRRRGGRPHGGPMVASSRRRGGTGSALPPAPRWKINSMTNSATSTDARRSTSGSGFQAWHFFTLLSMIGATVA